MNNIVQRWLRLSGLCPLLAMTFSVADAALLGLALLVTLLVTDLCMTLLQRWLAESQRLIITALIAALTAAVIDLLLQALCYEHAQHLQIYLPLLVIAPLLLFKADAAVIRPMRTLRAGLFGASAFVFLLTSSAALRALLPAEAGLALSFIVSALLLALANKIGPSSAAAYLEPSPHTARTRARVTGPVR
jgi:Na+-translocating ferredoxin:NAD+ oxidoreductase RnfE subunit